ncbi:phage GP46 family protein [Pannonibacter sp. Pt2]|uniref:Phage GP46 family protein n=1 Tax=Pannonibacter anstelovis TaxID=3121537 RepID=A0ABU7ZS17_9HYPH
MFTADAPAEFADLALAFDPVTRRGDLALTEAGELVIDYTPATSMMLSAGLDRRANPDDTLPTGTDFFSAARGAFGLRRGALADALDGEGRRTGTRLWLLDREKQDDGPLNPDQTRARALAYLAEAFAWSEVELAEAAVITAEWLRPGVLGWTARVRDVVLRGSVQGGAV